MKGFNGLPPYMSIALIILALAVMIASAMTIIDSGNMCMRTDTGLLCYGIKPEAQVQEHPNIPSYPLMEG